MGTNITTEYYVGDSAQRFVDDISDRSYYFFTACHVPPANSAVANASTDVASSFTNAYRNMISGKKIGSNAVSLVIRNIPYQANTVYSMYDDEVELDDLDYYTVINASSFYHVFKCLDNNMGSASTIPPNFSDIVGSNTVLYQTSDGYRWKYMYSVDSATNLKFGTSDFIPLVPNTAVQNLAVAGSILVIKVEDVGRGYGNYLTGTLKATDIQIAGNPTVYQLSSANAVSVNGYYTGCILYISAGTGQGQYAEVVDYLASGSGNFLTLNTGFSTLPVNGTQYQLYPKVSIKGGGDETISVAARALINSLASNSVYRVEVLNPGAGYTYAAANVVANASVGVLSQASVRPILPPRNGHGFDPASELLCRNASISVSLANTEGNTIPAVNQYGRVGILRDPLFADVIFNMTSVTGNFLPGEEVVTYTGTRAVSSSVMTAGSANVTTSISDFRETFSAGSPIVLKSADGTAWQYTTVNSVVNSSMITIASNALFTESAAVIYYANVYGTATAKSILTGSSIEVVNCTPSFANGSAVIGTQTGARGIVANTARQGVTKGFDTFVQLHKYVGALSFGTFIPNEVVFQGSPDSASAALHSTFANSGQLTMYTSNQVGQFAVGNNVTGQLSTAVMSVATKYDPELIFGTGVPVYVENLSPITRNSGNTETFQIILTF